jgi:hypothetical protein
MVGERQGGLRLGVAGLRLGFQRLQIGDGQSSGFIEKGISGDPDDWRAHNLQWRRNGWRRRYGLRGLGCRVIRSSIRFRGEWLAVRRRFVSSACQRRTRGASVRAELDDELVSD